MPSAKMLSLIALVIFFCCPVQAAQQPPEKLEKTNRGVALMGQFNFTAAYSTFSDLARKYPDDLELAINMGIALLNRQQRGDEDKALALFENILQKDSENTRARYCAALLHLHSGDLEKALMYLEAVSRDDPEDSDVHYFLGKTLMQLSRYEEALKAYRKAIELDQYISSGYYGSIISLRKLGKRDEAFALIKQYRSIKNNPRARTIEFKYTRMGQKALATTPNQIQKDVTRKKGPLFLDALPITIDNIESEQPSVPGSGNITIADINQDGYLDLFIAGLSCGDLVNGILLGGPELTRFSLAKNHPFSTIPDVNTILWGDINNDGMVDAYILRRGSDQLWQQNSENTWVNRTSKSGITGKEQNSTAGRLIDADHDGDLDIFVLSDGGNIELYNNNRDGSFTPLAEKTGMQSGKVPAALIIQDFDTDRDADLFLINRHPPHQTFLNDRLWRYRKTPGNDELADLPLAAMTAGDTNSDGKIELYTLEPSGKLKQWTRDNSRWNGMLLGTLPPPNQEARLALSDCDGDTALDFIITDRQTIAVYSRSDEGIRQRYVSTAGTPILSTTVMATINGPAILAVTMDGMPLIYPPGEGRYNYITIDLNGRESQDANLRTNVSAIGTRVAARIGSRWTVQDSYQNNGAPGQNDQPMIFGLSGEEKADFISIDWPDGVFQTEMDLLSGKHYSISETQRQMSSCPVLFGWDGEKFDFITDLLGVGGIGYAIGPGVYAEPRPWEHLLLPGRFSNSRNNRIELIMAEPMEEVEYLDSVSLTAFDLPPGWSMVLDERMGILDPQPTGDPLFFRKIQRVKKALNQQGLEVTSLISQVDNRAAPVGTLDRRFIGRLASSHSLTLTFDSPIDTTLGTPALVAHGWVEYPYSQTSFAAWQAGADFIAPTIEYLDRSGNFQVLLEQFGYPAGMVRQMAVPLQNLPKGVSTIRISTNQEIYWDQLQIAFTEKQPDVEIHPLPLLGALLKNVGFAKRADLPQRKVYYDWSQRNHVWDARIQEGDYTRYGDITELVQTRDNGLAIIGPGDGMHISFEVPSSPPPSGWTRRYVLSSYGWCKDMDLFTRDGETVAPLPGAPENPYVRKLHEKYNIRYQSGRL